MNHSAIVFDPATRYQPQSGEIFVAKSPEYMLEVQRTAIYFGALHLRISLFKKATNMLVLCT